MSVTVKFIRTTRGFTDIRDGDLQFFGGFIINLNKKIGACSKGLVAAERQLTLLGMRQLTKQNSHLIQSTPPTVLFTNKNENKQNKK